MRIDPQPYEAALAQAKAELGQATAGQQKTDQDEQRQSELFNKKIANHRIDGAHLHESDRTLRDGSFGVALSQALRARLRSHSPSGTFATALAIASERGINSSFWNILEDV